MRAVQASSSTRSRCASRRGADRRSAFPCRCVVQASGSTRSRCALRSGVGHHREKPHDRAVACTPRRHENAVPWTVPVSALRHHAERRAGKGTPTSGRHSPPQAGGREGPRIRGGTSRPGARLGFSVIRTAAWSTPFAALCAAVPTGGRRSLAGRCRTDLARCPVATGGTRWAFGGWLFVVSRPSRAAMPVVPPETGGAPAVPAFFGGGGCTSFAPLRGAVPTGGRRSLAGGAVRASSGTWFRGPAGRDAGRRPALRRRSRAGQ